MTIDAQVEILSSTEWEKGGVWSYLTNLTLHNKNQDAQWFFVARRFDEEMFEKAFVWRVDLCQFTTLDSYRFIDIYSTQSMVAFYIPAKARLILHDWNIESLTAEVQALTIWAAEGFTIDGKNELEAEWFPETPSSLTTQPITDAGSISILAYKKFDKEKPSLLRLRGVVEKHSIPVNSS